MVALLPAGVCNNAHGAAFVATQRGQTFPAVRFVLWTRRLDRHGWWWFVWVRLRQFGCCLLLVRKDPREPRSPAEMLHHRWRSQELLRTLISVMIPSLSRDLSCLCCMDWNAGVNLVFSISIAEFTPSDLILKHSKTKFKRQNCEQFCFQTVPKFSFAWWETITTNLTKIRRQQVLSENYKKETRKSCYQGRFSLCIQFLFAKRRWKKNRNAKKKEENKQIPMLNSLVPCRQKSVTQVCDLRNFVCEKMLWFLEEGKGRDWEMATGRKLDLHFPRKLWSEIMTRNCLVVCSYVLTKS